MHVEDYEEQGIYFVLTSILENRHFCLSYFHRTVLEQENTVDLMVICYNVQY